MRDEDSPKRNSQRLFSVSDSRASNTAAPIRRYVNVHTTSDRVLTFCLFILAVLNHAGIPRAPNTGSTLRDRKFSEWLRTLYELAETTPRQQRHSYDGRSRALRDIHMNIYLAPDSGCAIDLWGISHETVTRYGSRDAARTCTILVRDGERRCTPLAPSIDREGCAEEFPRGNAAAHLFLEMCGDRISTPNGNW